MSKKKTVFYVIAIVVVILIVLLGLLYGLNLIGNQRSVREEQKEEYQQSNINNVNKQKDNNQNSINIALIMDDEITKDTAWCGTFQLIWNDLKNDVVKQDIVFNPQLKVVENLNKGSFNTTQISDSSYYKAQGIPTQELKEQIENGIKEKFNETSDILDDFDWGGAGPNDYFLYCMLRKDFEFPVAFTKLDDFVFDGDPNKYFIYAMLKKEFEFENEFDELDDGKFGEYNDVEYFGINSNSNELLRNQVQVLYYNSKEDFAIKLLTKQNDEVIIARGNEGNTFNEIYNDVKNKQTTYQGNTELSEVDNLQIPKINFDVKKEFEELEDKEFETADREIMFIEKALQTIEFELDEKGGKVESEAGMMVNKMSALPEESEPREFIVDDTFTIFLQEEGKEMPYFCANIDDITKFQD